MFRDYRIYSFLSLSISSSRECVMLNFSFYETSIRELIFFFNKIKYLNNDL